MSNDVPLLTADQAATEMQDCWAANYDALEAIADGRAVVVPRMTEAEARAMCAQNAGSADDYAINLDGYLAALRDLGIIRD